MSDQTATREREGHKPDRRKMSPSKVLAIIFGAIAATATIVTLQITLINQINAQTADQVEDRKNLEKEEVARIDADKMLEAKIQGSAESQKIWQDLISGRLDRIQRLLEQMAYGPGGKPK